MAPQVRDLLSTGGLWLANVRFFRFPLLAQARAHIPPLTESARVCYFRRKCGKPSTLQRVYGLYCNLTAIVQGRATLTNRGMVRETVLEALNPHQIPAQVQIAYLSRT